MVVWLSVVGGCSVFFPAHPDSYDLRGEQVTIAFEPIDVNAKDRLAEASSGARTKGVIAPLVGPAVGFAVDQIKAAIDQEATLYEAQYSTSKSGAFWGLHNGEEIPLFGGLRIIRETSEAKPALQLTCAFEYSDDLRYFKIVPKELRMSHARAKVLRKAVWAPLTWFARTTGDVDVEVAFEVVAPRQTDKGSESVTLGSWTMALHSIALPSTKTAFGSESGWIPVVPRSSDGAASVGAAAGLFTVRATVTERDPSNAKSVVERTSKFVEENKTTIVEIIVPKEENPKP
jgi:hypothetical protein